MTMTRRGHITQRQQLSCAAWQLARARVHLPAAQSSPGSRRASSQIRSWLRQIEVDRVQTSLQWSLDAGWQVGSLAVGVVNGSLIATAQAEPLQGSGGSAMRARARSAAM